MVLTARGFFQLPGRTRSEIFRAQALSLSAHFLIGLLLLLPVARRVIQQSPPTKSDESPIGPLFIPSSLFKGNSDRPAHGGGSGGEENPVPATKGKLPPFSWLQFTPPMPPRNPHPRLTEAATLVGPPEIQVPNISNMRFGLPNASEFTDSAGPGHLGGYGNESGGGIGRKGNGRGYENGEEWGTNGGRPQRGGALAADPQCAYCPSPVYSDEARLAKIQGSVLIRALVLPDGRGTNLSVVRGLSFGLDEKALEAVRDWRFKPGRDVAGRAAPAWVTIEVVFRLL